MNLVCFPGWCGGGIVCDLLNNKRSAFRRSVVMSPEHNVLKLTEMGVKSTDYNEWSDIAKKKWIKVCSNIKSSDMWFGTHAKSESLPNIYDFDKRLNITTANKTSVWFRFLRQYHIDLKIGLYKSEKSKLEKITYFMNYMLKEGMYLPNDQFTNIEFEHIINGSFVQENDLDIEHFEKWKKLNHWLYEKQEDWLVKLFDECSQNV